MPSLNDVVACAYVYRHLRRHISLYVRNCKLQYCFMRFDGCLCAGTINNNNYFKGSKVPSCTYNSVSCNSISGSDVCIVPVFILHLYSICALRVTLCTYNALKLQSY